LYLLIGAAMNRARKSTPYTYNGLGQRVGQDIWRVMGEGIRQSIGEGIRPTLPENPE